MIGSLMIFFFLGKDVDFHLWEGPNIDMFTFQFLYILIFACQMTIVFSLPPKSMVKITLKYKEIKQDD